jgi:hypothetical protein
MLQQVPDYDTLKTIIGDFSYGIKTFQARILDKYIKSVFEEA